MEIYVDDETKLTLHGLVQVLHIVGIFCFISSLVVLIQLMHVFLILSVQHYILLKEGEKNRKLNDLLDALDFNQVVIFVKSVNRAAELNKLLEECNFPSICIHSGMAQEERYGLCCLDSLSDGKSRAYVFKLNAKLLLLFLSTSQPLYDTVRQSGEASVYVRWWG